jgi:hypothetical protein
VREERHMNDVTCESTRREIGNKLTVDHGEDDERQLMNHMKQKVNWHQV